MAGTAVARGVPREITVGRNAIPVIGANEIPRIQFSSGAARALQQFSRDMFSLSDSFQDQADQIVEAEATSQGAIQGATGTMELQSYGTIRGRAYNKAAIESFVTTMETQSIHKVAELSRLYGNDPARLQAELEAWANGAAGEIEKIYPAAGPAFRQRTALRSAPAVEAARDARYKLTRDQADAALIENEIALNAEIASSAADLFSENPERSKAASQSVAVLQREYSKIYDAVDPTTGQPLYSPSEKAKAKAAFYENVMETAAVSWFEQQPDKAGAYLKFTEGDFTIQLQGAPSVNLSPEISGIIDAAAARYEVPADALKTIAWIESKGDPNAKNPTSSAGGLFQQIDANAAQYDVGNRFDPVASADGAARFMADNMAQLRSVLGREPTTAELYLAHQQGPGGATSLLANPGSRAADIVGLDAVRLNGGSPGMSAAEFAGLWQKKVEKVALSAPSASVDVRKMLSPEKMSAIESEMRARINFSNGLADRRSAAEEKANKRFQDSVNFELTNRIFSEGATDPETGEPVEPVTREEITTRVRKGFIDPDMGRALIKALETEKPERSDRAVLNDALRRVYAGENIYNFLIENTEKLSPTDLKDLLGKNQSLNVVGDGDMTKEQKYQHDALSDLLTPDSMMAKIDEGAEDRKFLALNEFRRRMKDGEDPEVVAFELRDRASRTFQTLTNSKLDAMVQPRFSVQRPDGRLDLKESGRALIREFQADRISAEEFEYQKRTLKMWSDIQTSLDKAKAVKQ